MKTIKLFIATCILFVGFQSANAQSGKEDAHNTTKTQTIKVYGECGMCKKRIEKAATSVEGVRSAVWDEHTKNLSLQYSPFGKETPDSVQKKVAAVGYDTDKYSADDKVYQKLPACCKYERKQAKQ